MALAAVPLLVLGVFFALPVGGMLARGLNGAGGFDPAGLVAVLARPRVHRVIWFTVWSSSVATVLSVLLALPAAYALYRLDFLGRRLIRGALLVPFVLPTVVVGAAIRRLLAPGGQLAFLGWDGTPPAIIAGLVFFNVAVVIRAVGTSWESLDPRPAQAAAALGASPAQVLHTVTLPALRPAIIASASVVFLFCATSFGVVLTLGGLRYATVETEIYLLTTNLLDLRGAAVLSLVQLTVVIGLLLVGQRLRARGDATVPRGRVLVRKPVRGDAAALTMTALLVGLVATPLVLMVVSSLRVDGAWSLRHYLALAKPDQDVSALEALGNSLATAVDATWMSVGLGLVVAAVATRRSRSVAEGRVRATLDGLFMLPLGVSAVTLGFGFLITLDRPPVDLRDSRMLVPIAQALVALPLVVRTLTPVLGSVDERLRQAAASLGASPWRASLTVDLPVLWKPLLAASGFAFAVSLGEFGATSFLSRADHPTLPIVIYRLLSHPGVDNYGTALAASVLLGAVTAAIVLAVEQLRVPSWGAL
jgi:thiamine transport system permease protein